MCTDALLHTFISTHWFQSSFCWFVFLFFTLYDRIHLTRAGWAAGAGWLEPCGCCHWTPLLPPSLSADALETRWPQHPPSPPPRGAARTEGHACMLTARPQARMHMQRPWLMHTQVNENKQTTTSPDRLFFSLPPHWAIQVKPALGLNCTILCRETSLHVPLMHKGTKTYKLCCEADI